eukprot:5429840-Amphidinium_carterae.1
MLSLRGKLCSRGQSDIQSTVGSGKAPRTRARTFLVIDFWMVEYRFDWGKSYGDKFGFIWHKLNKSFKETSLL